MDSVYPPKTVQVRRDFDVVACRQVARELAEQVGLSKTDRALLATAVSELARNIIDYAGAGKVDIEAVLRGEDYAVRVTAVDKGPGIIDVGRALEDGYSSGEGLGLGLPGTKRIVDEFSIQSSDQGTVVSIVKWASR